MILVSFTSTRINEPKKHENLLSGFEQPFEVWALSQMDIFIRDISVESTPLTERIEHGLTVTFEIE